MRIALFAPAGDAIADRVSEGLRRGGAETVRTVLDGSLPIAFDGESWLCAGEDLGACDAFFLRQYPSFGARLERDPSVIATAGEWWRRGVEQLERAHLAQSCLLDLERANKPLINPIGASGSFDYKPFQLAAFRRAGFPIPRTLITNLPRAVEIFARDAGALIAKPVAGGAEARALEELDPAALESIRTSPVIFQERVHGTDIRVTVVGGQVVSAVELPSETLDYRSSEAYRRGDQRYVAHALPPSITTLCTAAAALCHHVLSGIDLKLRSSGEYVLIEANSAPVYLDLERKTGAPITEAIVKWLLDRAGGTA